VTIKQQLRLRFEGNNSRSSTNFPAKIRLTCFAGTGENPGPTTNEGKAALTVVEEDENASDGIGVENFDTKVGTTKLFGLPEATGVAVADGEAAKPAPDAANDEA